MSLLVGRGSEATAVTEHFADRLALAVQTRGTPAVVGLDPVFEWLPPGFAGEEATRGSIPLALESFCRAVVDCVAPLVPAVKINSAFFEAYRAEGLAAFFRLVAYARRHGLLVISDVKRGDIGSTALLYARGHLHEATTQDGDPLSIPDAVTLSGYLGENSVRPFIEAARDSGRGIFVLVRPSDPGADEVHEFGEPTKFYEHMAALVDRWGSRPELLGECGYSCVGAVVAPKDAHSTASLRRRMPATLWLVPGYGAQGATAETCRPCFRPDGSGAIVSASRSLIYAFREPRFRAQAEDWTACVACACREFAAAIARVAASAG